MTIRLITFHYTINPQQFCKYEDSKSEILVSSWLPFRSIRITACTILCE